MNRSFWKSITGLAVAGLLALPAQAQVQDAATAYNNGKILVQQQRYEQAMTELLPLTDASSAYAPEASYFYALAALKAGETNEAYRMLLQLQNQQPAAWENMPDADYLLANVLFELNEYDRALSKLQELAGSPLAADAEGLKRFYLAKLADRNAFENLLQRYPNDKTIAQVFADKLIGSWYRPQDRQTLENIVSKFSLNRNRYLRPDALSRQGFDVAVLLPFQLNQDMQQTARKSQFITDLYAGMKLAQDSLQQQGIHLNLYTYDAGADTAVVKRVLNTPELRQMDLVIGPVYKSAANVAARFAAENGVTIINPLSQELEMARGEGSVLLFEPSLATQARQAATFAFQQFSPKTAVILYENTKDDSIFAMHYRQQFLQLGGKVGDFRKINSSQAAATATAFNNLNLEEAGHLAVFSDKMTAAVNAASLLQGQIAGAKSAAVNAASPLQGQTSKLPLITYDEWLDINQITLRQLDDLEVYFIHPKYIDKQSPAAQQFRKNYISRYNLPPSVYAYAGFEMLYYFGTMLQNYGPQFSQQLAQAGIRPGVFFPGVGYADTSQRSEFHSDNQYVPITKLENLQLVVVNPVF